jgi:TRAP-type mannitol/chloroaromatic compound transport system substrate-binding protein
MSVALRKHGFQVIEGLDLDKAAFDQRVRDFALALKGTDAGVFFYAGHGLQVAGQNYLVPVDAKADEAAALDLEMVRVDVIHRIMERQTNTNILFLDACRDNPLARNLARSMGTRSSDVGRGLAAVESGVGTLISFSTQPGNVALDGTGRNSPFAGALVKQLLSPNDDLSAILIAVRNDVMRETHRKQVPWEHSALTGRFYFGRAPQAGSPPTPGPAQQISEAERTWTIVQGSKSVAVLEDFITRYKDTIFAKLAQESIDDLKKQQVAGAVPPKAPTPPPRADPPTPGAAVTPALTIAPSRPSQKPGSGSAWMDELRTWLEGSGPVLAPLGDVAPMTVPPRELKGQSAFGSTIPVLGTLPDEFSSEVGRVSGGKVKLVLQQPGAIVPAFEILPAVGKGTLDAGWTTAGYHTGTDAAFLGLDGTLPFGLPPHKAHAWLEQRGEALKDEVYRRHGAKAFTCGMTGPEGAGWFRSPIKTVENLKGLKMRFFGFGTSVLQKLGVNTQLLAGVDVVPALERGAIDATEFSIPYVDKSMGFHRIVKHYYYPGWHQPAWFFDFIVNLKVWKSFSTAQKAVVETACRRVLHRSVEAIRRQQKDGLDALAKEGVKPLVLPGPVLDALEKAAREVLADEAARNPFFKRTLESYQAYR